MGGYGSGRWGGRPTVENSLTLNLSRLFKSGWLKARASTRGTLRWPAAWIGDEMSPWISKVAWARQSGYMHLRWTSTDQRTGEKRECENHIALTTRPQPFGGRRWWFICPRTGRLASRLHLPCGAHTFACRRAYRLGYRSQRQTPRDRAVVPRLRATPEAWQPWPDRQLYCQAERHALAHFRTSRDEN